MDCVWSLESCTAETCRETLGPTRPLKDSTIRTILRRLEEKGYVTHSVEGRTYVFRPTQPRRNVAVRAVQQIIDRFCGGSVEQLLVGMVENDVLGPKELKRLERQLARRRERKP